MPSAAVLSSRVIVPEACQRTRTKLLSALTLDLPKLHKESRKRCRAVTVVCLLGVGHRWVPAGGAVPVACSHPHDGGTVAGLWRDLLLPGLQICLPI